MTDDDLRAWLQRDLGRPEPPPDLAGRARRRLRRVRRRRRTGRMMVGGLALLAVVTVLPRVLPATPGPGVTLQPAEPAAPPERTAAEPAPLGAGDPVPASEAPANPGGCAGAPSPGGTGERVSDLDGDGVPDLVVVTVGAVRVETATGVSPLLPTTETVVAAGAADVDSDGRNELLLAEPRPGGEAYRVARLVGCALEYVTNVQGEPYVFEVGSDGDALVGVGCTDVDGDEVPELVGLRSVFDEASGDYRVERTVVTIDDGRASNGAVDEVFVEGEGVGGPTLGQATCGDRPITQTTFPR